MQTFYVIFNDPKWGFSIDVWSDRGAGPRSALQYFNVTPASRERLRKIFRVRRDRVTVFEVWSRSRIDAYRVWSNVQVTRRADALSLDHLETSEPPHMRLGL